MFVIGFGLVGWFVFLATVEDVAPCYISCKVFLFYFSLNRHSSFAGAPKIISAPALFFLYAPRFLPVSLRFLARRHTPLLSAFSISASLPAGSGLLV